MADFLKTPAGHAVFGIVIALVAIVIIELNYRLFFKYVLDFIFSLLAVIITSPVLLAGAVISSKRAGRVFDKTPYLGSKGKIVYFLSFAGIDKGIKNLPRLLNVLSGKLSIVGISLLKISDGALLDDKAMERFSTRPGIVNHLALHGDESLTYEEAFALDRRYVKKRELFTDIFIVLKSIVLAIRGEGKSYLGETYKRSYGEVLLERGTITPEDLERAESYASEAESDIKKREDFKNGKL